MGSLQIKDKQWKQLTDKMKHEAVVFYAYAATLFACARLLYGFALRHKPIMTVEQVYESLMKTYLRTMAQWERKEK